MSAFLALATGDVFPGEMICRGELLPGQAVIYHADKFPYRILTDPVGYGKIIVSDCQMVDNRWPYLTEIESYSPHLKALVILGDLLKSPFQDKRYNLVNYLKSNGITLFKPDKPAALNTLLMQSGPVPGIITDDLTEINQLYIKKTPPGFKIYEPYSQSLDNLDPVRKLSTRLEFFWDLPDQELIVPQIRKYLIVAYDFGLAYSILRNIKKLGCDIRIVPADCSPEDVIALKPEGILLAGGPGGLEGMGYAVNNISRLVGLRPILATGLGHILLASALGAKIEKMKQPHFGTNIEIQSVAGLDLGLKENYFVTTQTHLLTPDRTTFDKGPYKVTFTNRNDQTVEAFESADYLLQSYAFSLGGDDYLTKTCLNSFIAEMESHRAAGKIS